MTAPQPGRPKLIDTTATTARPQPKPNRKTSAARRRRARHRRQVQQRTAAIRAFITGPLAYAAARARDLTLYLIGAACLTRAMWLWTPIAGWATLGAAVLYLQWLLTDGPHLDHDTEPVP